MRGGPPAARGPLAVLDSIRQARPLVPGERCEMCANPIPETHSHVVDIRNRSLMCACRACYLLFTRDDAKLAYRSVPDRYMSFPSFELTPSQWDDLAIPVGIAFFFAHSELERIAAFYPSPAGATESELPLDAWQQIVDANPGLETLKPDVEAVLLREIDDSFECYIVPIDSCYELVGHLRRLWRGFDGGSEVRHQLSEYFAGLAKRSRPARRDPITGLVV